MRLKTASQRRCSDEQVINIYRQTAQVGSTYPLLPSLHNTLKQVVSFSFCIQTVSNKSLDHILDLADSQESIDLEHDLNQVAEPHVGEGHSHGTKADTLEDEGDPGMIVDILETVEGLAKDEIAHDVKGRPVVPGLEVERGPAAITVLVDPLDQEVDVSPATPPGRTGRGPAAG